MRLLWTNSPQTLETFCSTSWCTSSKTRTTTLKLAKSEEERQLSFRIILSERDVAKLIGKNGFTASAIRSVIKAAGEKHDINVLLRINSVSEEAERMASA